MPNFTPNFRFGYFRGNDIYAPDIERQRWVLLDKTLAALFDLLGNGVISGFEPAGVVGQSNRIVISPGSGISGGFIVIRNTEYSLDLATLAPGDYKLIVKSTSTSNYDQSCEMATIPAGLDVPQGAFGVCQFNVTPQKILGGLADIRTYLGVTGQVIQAVRTHVHNGEGFNPPKINLEQHVQGILPLENIPDIPINKVVGSISDEHIKNFSHKKLEDIGILNHFEIDEYISSLSSSKKNQEYMGVVVAINSLMYLLKKIETEQNRNLLKYLFNTRAILPGATPTSWADLTKTTEGAYSESTLSLRTPVFAQELNPSQSFVVRLDEVNGDYGFMGPKVRQRNNLSVVDVGGGKAEVSLIRTEVIQYYHTSGSFSIRFNAGSSVKWQRLEFEHVILGAQAELGGDSGFNVGLKARSSLLQQNLERNDWVVLTEKIGDAYSLTRVPDNKWLEIKFDLNTPASSNSRVNLLIKKVKIYYDTGSGKSCGFVFYPQLDDWLDDAIRRRGISISSEDAKIRLVDTQYYRESATYTTRVLSANPDSFVHWGWIKLCYKLPAGTQLKLWMRSSPEVFQEDNNTISWVPLDTVNPSDAKPMDCIRIAIPHPQDDEYKIPVSDPYLQIKLQMIRSVSSSDEMYSPELLDFSISWYLSLNEASYFDNGSLSIDVQGNGVYTFNNSVDFSKLKCPNSPYYFSISNPKYGFLTFYPNKIIANSTTKTLDFKVPAYIDQLPVNLSSTVKLNHASTNCIVFGGSNTSLSNKFDAEGSSLSNLTTDEYFGGLTLQSKHKTGKWISPRIPLRSIETCLWDDIEVVGSNLDTVSLSVQVTNMEDDSSWTTLAVEEGAYYASPSKISLDLKKYSKSVRQAKYIRFILDINP